MATLPAIIETPMGRVDARLTVANSVDQARANAGEIDKGAVRSVTLEGVLVDTGATLLCLPANVIAALGLAVMDEVPIETASGAGVARLFGPTHLTVEGRHTTTDVLELPAGRTPLLGVIPMEALGIEPDLQNRRLRLLPRELNNTYITVL
jgi:predicted aspartyl protease